MHIPSYIYNECKQYVQYSTVSTHSKLTGSAPIVEYQSLTLKISRSVSSMSTIFQHKLYGLVIIGHQPLASIMTQLSL